MCSGVVDKDNFFLLIMALFVVKIVGEGSLVWMWRVGGGWRREGK